MWWILLGILGFAVYTAVICAILDWFFLYHLPGEGIGPLAVHYTLVDEDKKNEHEEGHHGDEDSK